MKATDSFKLIEGRFDTEDASEILSSLIESKIKFHKHKIFSNEIRFGTKDEHSLERIQALQLSQEKILNLIKEARLNQKKVTIHSTISIEIDA
jgi:hypothetical protein